MNQVHVDDRYAAAYLNRPIQWVRTQAERLPKGVVWYQDGHIELTMAALTRLTRDLMPLPQPKWARKDLIGIPSWLRRVR